MIPHQRLVANLIGIQTSKDQSEIRYFIDQLHESMLAVRVLRDELMDLRKKMAYLALSIKSQQYAAYGRRTPLTCRCCAQR
jgi:hypothetical protein